MKLKTIDESFQSAVKCTTNDCSRRLEKSLEKFLAEDDDGRHSDTSEQSEMA